MVLLSPLPASEPALRTASWDSLAIPLEIAPLYLQISSEALAKSVSIELDLYVKGEFKRTISSGGLSWTDKTVPLAINAAIYLMPSEEGESKMVMVLEWDGARGVSRASFPQADFPFAMGMASGETGEPIHVPGRIPVFRAIAGGQGYRLPKHAMDTPKENPEASVLIGYLKVE